MRDGMTIGQETKGEKKCDRNASRRKRVATWSRAAGTLGVFADGPRLTMKRGQDRARARARQRQQKCSSSPFEATSERVCVRNPWGSWAR